MCEAILAGVLHGDVMFGDIVTVARTVVTRICGTL